VVKDQEIPAQCEGIVIAGLESPFGVENGLVEPSLQAHPLEAIYIIRTSFLRPPGGTGEGLECYPSGPKAHKRIPSGTLSQPPLVTSSSVEQPQAWDSSLKL
jgi:hypothetical protein